MELITREITEEQDGKQSDMAIGLSLATTLNECCDSVDDVRDVLLVLSDILQVRYGVNFRVSLEE